MVKWVTILTIIGFSVAAHAQESGLEKEKPLEKRVISEWDLAGDLLNVVLNDVQKAQLGAAEDLKLPGVSEICFDLGSAFQRTVSALSKTSFIDGSLKSAEIREEMSNIRSGVAALADLCTKESSNDWHARLPEFEVALKSILELRADLVSRLTLLAGK